MTDKTVQLTEPMLKDLMTDAVCSRNWCNDANLIDKSGIYPFGAGTQNVANVTEGVIIHFKSPNAMFGHLQILYSSNTGKGLLIRIWWSGEWSPWEKFAKEAS